MARRRKRKAEEGSLADAALAAPQASRLTPVDIQQKVFRLAFRGYNERDVDEFLDHVTETLASLHEDNKRLRESAQEGGRASPVATAAAERQAAEIVRQAREHAARLVEVAERRVTDVGGSEGGGAAAAAQVSGSFMAREREFLQRMASLIQGHARTLKEEALRSREAPPATEAATTGGQGDVGAQPQPAADDVTAMPAQEPSAPEPAPPAEEATAAPIPESPAAAGGQGDQQEAPAPSPAEGEQAPGEESGFERPGPAAPEAAVPSSQPSAPAFPPGPGESDEDSPTVPWRPSESESPAEAGWSMEGSGEEGDPLLSAWESAFLSKPEDEAGPAPPPAGEKDREGEEPSLRELFWGEE